MTTNPTLAPVIQADRDAADDFLGFKRNQVVCAVHQRERSRLSEAFARHRISHTPTPAEGPSIEQRAKQIAHSRGDPNWWNFLDEARAAASLSATADPTPAEGVVERVWTALKNRCAADPEKAKRVVMVNRDDIAAALQSSGLDAASDPEANLVACFAAALLTKMRASEEKYGWKRAWLGDDWADDLRAEIRRHVEKGDPIDVAAYAAFAWHHGWTLAPSLSPHQAEPVERAAQAFMDAGADTIREGREALADQPEHEREILLVCIAAALKAAGLDAAIEALEPFAKAADMADERMFVRFLKADLPDSTTVLGALNLTLGHIRRARTTLANLRGQS